MRCNHDEQCVVGNMFICTVIATLTTVTTVMIITIIVAAVTFSNFTILITQSLSLSYARGSTGTFQKNTSEPGGSRRFKSSCSVCCLSAASIEVFPDRALKRISVMSDRLGKCLKESGV